LEGEIGGAEDPGEIGQGEEGGLGGDDFRDAVEESLGGQDSVDADEAWELWEQGEKSEEVGDADQAGEAPEADGVVHGR